MIICGGTQFIKAEVFFIHYPRGQFLIKGHLILLVIRNSIFSRNGEIYKTAFIKIRRQIITSIFVTYHEIESIGNNNSLNPLSVLISYNSFDSHTRFIRQFHGHNAAWFRNFVPIISTARIKLQ